jgi:hydrogenase/urease accessory protein HupE
MKSLSCGALVVFFALPAPSARAHTVGVSRGEYRVIGPALEATLVFARPEVAAALSGLDPDRDGVVSATELSEAQALVGDWAVRGLEVRSPAGRCDGAFQGAVLTEEDGIAIRAAYRCLGTPAPVAARLGLLGSLSLGHRHLATVTDPSGAEGARAVLYESRPDLPIRASPGGAESDASSVAWPLFRLGIQHILTGYDHLLFLLGLILVGGRLRPLLVVVTAFTVAHSVTLGLAALGVWAPSSRVVEPAIALSIAYVGVENWFVRDADRRWLITFPFGLVHGFGFAGALQEISLPSSQVPVALLAFNLGVEAGQLAVLALVLPAVLCLARSPWFAGRGVKVTSAAIAAAGLFWFVSRLAGR